MNGTVKRVNPKGKFGFIKGEDNKEYFFHLDDYNGHWVDLETDLDNKVTVKVEFRPGMGKKGPRAEQVVRKDFPNESTGDRDYVDRDYTGD